MDPENFVLNLDVTAFKSLLASLEFKEMELDLNPQMNKPFTARQAATLGFLRKHYNAKVGVLAGPGDVSKPDHPKASTSGERSKDKSANKASPMAKGTVKPVQKSVPPAKSTTAQVKTVEKKPAVVKPEPIKISAVRTSSAKVPVEAIVFSDDSDAEDRVSARPHTRQQLLLAPVDKTPVHVRLKYPHWQSPGYLALRRKVKKAGFSRDFLFMFYSH